MCLKPSSICFEIKTGLVESFAPVVSVATTRLSRLTSRLNYISDIRHYFGHDKPSSISQLINGKSRNLLNFIKCFNGTTIRHLTYPYHLVCSLSFYLIFKKLKRLFCCYLSCYYYYQFQ